MQYLLVVTNKGRSFTAEIYQGDKLLETFRVGDCGEISRHLLQFLGERGEEHVITLPCFGAKDRCHVTSRPVVNLQLSDESCGIDRASQRV